MIDEEIKDAEEMGKKYKGEAYVSVADQNV